MQEIDQLKKRIDASGPVGVETAHIRDDYEPAGAMMIHLLCINGDYVQRECPPHSFNQRWRIFKKGIEPY